MLQNLSDSLPVKGDKGYLAGPRSKSEKSESRLTQLKNDNYTEADKDMLKNLDITNDVLNLRKFKKIVKTINLMTDKDDIDRHNTGKGKAEAEVNVSKVFNDRVI